MRRPVTPTHAATIALAAGLDAACVLAFVAIGRYAHHDGATVAGIWHTAWPFLTGLVVGLAAVRFWRQPLAIGRAGVGAWAGAAGVGMLIRVVAGQGTAAAFILVATAFLALFLGGWRAVAIAARHFGLSSKRTAQRG
jgi:hypothetical protein